jgi:hypothetical protein
MARKKKSNKYRNMASSPISVVSYICDELLHESVAFTSCEIRMILHDAIDCNKKGQNGFLIVI